MALTIRDSCMLKPGTSVSVLAKVNHVKKFETKLKKDMAIATCSDATGQIDVIAFPEVFARNGDLFTIGAMLTIEGRIDRRGNEKQLVCESAKRSSLRDRVRSAVAVPSPSPVGRTITSPPVGKAIPTIYQGITFRSRLEARWAAFFDALKEPWEFEPEGYQLESGWYLPDFWLQTWISKGSFWEVKPTLEAMNSQKIEQLVLLTGKHCCVSVGPPWDAKIIKFAPVISVQKLETSLRPEAQSIADRIRGMSFWDPS